MKVLGISNPQFTGVSVATRANCTMHLGVGHMDNLNHVQQTAQKILDQKPSVLLVGGWSRGYEQLLRMLKKVRKFPIIACYHSTPFHGNFFGDDQYVPLFEAAYHSGDYDVMAFVHPQTAAYYSDVRGISCCVFLPHSFKLQERVKEQPVFRIGVFGGLAKWHKNSYGALTIAKDFCAQNQNCEVVAAVDYDLPHKEFLKQMETCSVLIHVSHLECYSNMVQEAWARGIPVITSPASNGLSGRNPLLSEEDKVKLSSLSVMCATDPVDLYLELDRAKRDWDVYAENVHDAYGRLTASTTLYVNKLYEGLASQYSRGQINIDSLNLFTEEQA